MEDLDLKFPSVLGTQMKFSMALNQRKIIINDEITSDISLEVLYYLTRIKELDEKLGEEKPPIEIYVDSVGGDAFAGFSIVDMIEQMKSDGYKIITINMAKAFSAGMMIALCGSTRKAFAKSRYMFHDVSSGTMGKSREMRESLEETEVIRDIYSNVIEKYSDIDAETIEYYIERKIDKFFSANEMLELKGVDVVL